jgi:hypothetical protein
MSTEFSPNTVQYGDAAGLGAWSDGHFRQHLRYNAVLAARTPAVVLPEFPILNAFQGNRQEIRFWLNAHENWHEQLRPFANVSGANLADLDIDNERLFYEWQDTHNIEHALLDQAFGVA